MIVVPDTSPLILLAKNGRLELLPVLYDTCLVPQAVLDEIRAKSQADTRAILHWWSQHSISSRKVGASHGIALPSDMGAGERAVVALAIEVDADLTILDDQEARRIARAKDLDVTGTVGVLVEARARDHIASLRRELDRLVEAGLWISEAFYTRLIQEFDEVS